MSDDNLEERLRALKGNVPAPRTNLSEAEKAALVARVGPRTARSIVNAKRDFPVSRIPFLFSKIDTQDVVDLIANDVDEAIRLALARP
jgi:hypothetical protein